MQAGRELDAMVAEKVMGWKRMRWCDWKQDERTSLTYSWHDVDGKMVKLAENSDDYEDPRPAWSPSTSIADAWEVVEKIKQDRTLFPQVTLVRVHDSAWQHRCEIWKNDGKSDFGWMAEEYGATASEAICLAALKAVKR